MDKVIKFQGLYFNISFLPNETACFVSIDIYFNFSILRALSLPYCRRDFVCAAPLFQTKEKQLKRSYLLNICFVYSKTRRRSKREMKSFYCRSLKIYANWQAPNSKNSRSEILFKWLEFCMATESNKYSFIQIDVN